MIICRLHLLKIDIFDLLNLKKYTWTDGENEH